MKQVTSLLLILFTMGTVFGEMQVGIIVAVDKKAFTIKPPLGDKLTFTYDSDLGKKPKRLALGPGGNLGMTPDQIKTGKEVSILYYNEKGARACQIVKAITEQPLGTKELDFSPMLPKGKDKLPKFLLRVNLLDYPIQDDCGKGNVKRGFGFKQGTTVKEVRDTLQSVLFHEKWKVKAVDDTKLLIEAYKDNPVRLVKVEAEGLPKEQQPRVRFIRLQESKK